MALRSGGRSERIREAIFEAVSSLYVSHRPLPTMAAVAKQAGVPKSTLYRHWDNIEALIFDYGSTRVSRGLEIPDTGSLEADLRLLATNSYAFLSSVEGRHAVNMLKAAAPSSQQKYWSARYEGLSMIFIHAVSRKEIQDRGDWSVFLDMLIAPWYFHLWGKGSEFSLSAWLQAAELIASLLVLPRVNPHKSH